MFDGKWSLWQTRRWMKVNGLAHIIKEEHSPSMFILQHPDIVPLGDGSRPRFFVQVEPQVTFTFISGNRPGNA